MITTTPTPSALSFHDVEFHLIHRDPGQIWLTAVEIAKALGYAREDAVSKIYRRYADEFTDDMTLTVNLTVKGFQPQHQSPETVNLTVSKNDRSENPNLGFSERLKNETRIFSPRGAHLIAMFARTERAKEFRRWVLDVLEGQYRTQPPALPALNIKAQMLDDNSDPTVPLPAEVQQALTRRAWDISHEAYDTICQHLARRIAYTCEQGHPRKLNTRKALAEIAATTLDTALTPRATTRLEHIIDMADAAADLAIQHRDSIRAQMAAMDKGAAQ